MRKSTAHRKQWILLSFIKVFHVRVPRETTGVHFWNPLWHLERVISLSTRDTGYQQQLLEEVGLLYWINSITFLLSQTENCAGKVYFVCSSSRTLNASTLSIFHRSEESAFCTAKNSLNAKRFRNWLDCKFRQCSLVTVFRYEGRN